LGTIANRLFELLKNNQSKMLKD